MYKVSLRKPVLLGIFVLMLFLVPALTRDPYYLSILIRIALYVVACAGIWLLLTTGLLTIAHGAFVGIGAYTSVLLVMNLGVSSWVALVAAAALAAVTALVIGLPVLRLRGVYFVIVTLAFAEVMRLVWMRWRSLTGGAPGIRHIPAPDSISIPGLPDIVFAGANPSYYYYALILAVITVVVVYRLHRSRIGLAFRAISDAEQLAECMGVNIMRYKVVAFVIACALAGLAGAFYAHYMRYISPESELFTLSGLFNMVVFVVVGGAGSVAGPILGPFVLIPLSEALRPLKEYVPIIYGVFLILVVKFAPGGLVGLPREIWSLIGRREPAARVGSLKRVVLSAARRWRSNTPL